MSQPRASSLLLDTFLSMLGRGTAMLMESWLRRSQVTFMVVGWQVISRGKWKAGLVRGVGNTQSSWLFVLPMPKPTSLRRKLTSDVKTTWKSFAALLHTYWNDLRSALFIGQFLICPCSSRIVAGLRKCSDGNDAFSGLSNSGKVSFLWWLFLHNYPRRLEMGKHNLDHMTKWLLEVWLIKLGIDIRPEWYYGITRRYLICTRVGWNYLYSVVCVYQPVAFWPWNAEFSLRIGLTVIDASMYHGVRRYVMVTKATPFMISWLSYHSKAGAPCPDISMIFSSPLMHRLGWVGKYCISCRLL